MIKKQLYFVKMSLEKLFNELKMIELKRELEQHDKETVFTVTKAVLQQRFREVLEEASENPNFLFTSTDNALFERLEENSRNFQTIKRRIF